MLPYARPVDLNPAPERNTKPHPDDLFEWADGTTATREEIERGDFHFMSDDYALVPGQ